MTDAPKSCPFCGGPDLSKPGGYSPDGVRYVCAEIKCQLPIYGEGAEEKALAEWNTRTITDEVKTLRLSLAMMHRRAQFAESKLQRAQTWLDLRDENKSSPYVGREMEHFYLRHILNELKRKARGERRRDKVEG